MNLYPYQQTAATHLSAAVNKYGAVLDASDTGVGKTFVALGIARDHPLPVLVVCPKSVRTTWLNIAKDLGVELLDAINIEKLKAGNTPYLKKDGKTFVWRLAAGSLVIWDEIQNASGYKSQNGTILALTKAYRLKVVGLSATVAETPLKLKAIGYLLGLHQYRDHYSWCLQNGCFKNPWNGVEFVKTPAVAAKHLLKIHKQIFPERGNRIRIQDLDVFPENAVFADAYDVEENTDKINAIYDEAESMLLDADGSENALVILLRALQSAELLKIPLIAGMVGDLLDEGKSVVVFFNFKESFRFLASKLKTEHPLSYDQSLIYGGQTQADRDESIARFCRDETRVCIAMIQAGGVGVSLHDTIGNHPRVSLLVPTFNAVQLKQALGRIHRAGGKTKCIQRIIFAAGTVEEQACASVKRKIDNISLLNDGDLTAGLTTS